MKNPALLLLIPILAFFYLLLLGPGLTSDSPGSMDVLNPRGGLSCSPWKTVAAGAFGLPSLFDSDGNPVQDSQEGQPYRNEEGFETVVFNGQLYLGMEADNRLGARIWRTRTGVTAPQANSDWEEVIAGTGGRPWGVERLRQVDHIDSLAVFEGRLYASTANRDGPTGTRVFRSASGDPDDWEDALALQGPGFGNPANENFKDMVVFQDQLCGGTWNETSGAEVWCTTDGSRWEQKNVSGWGDSRTAVIWSSAVFKDGLYFGAQHFGEDPSSLADDTAVVYRTFSLDGEPAWEQVYQGDFLSVQAHLLGEFRERLYLSTTGLSGIEIFSSPNGSAGAWEPANIPGMAGSIGSNNTVTDGAVVYQDLLHVAVNNTLRGMRVWRSDGSGFWEIVRGPKEYAVERFAAQLVVFNGSLYAWTSDWSSGQAVLQTTCRAELGATSGPNLAGALVITLAGIFLL